MSALDPGGTVGWLFEWSWETSVVASVLIGLVLLIQSLAGQRLSARARYLLGSLVFIRLLLPWAPESKLTVWQIAAWLPSAPGITQPSADQQASSAWRPEQIEPAASAAIHAVSSDKPDSARWRRVLALAWVSGVVASLMTAGCQQLRCSRLLRGSTAVSDLALLQLLEESKRLMGVLRPVRMIETSHVAVPAVFGIFKPCLLLPQDLLSRVSTAELRLIILHELAHVRRWDTLLNWALIVERAWHWFNPLVWLAFRRWRADRELVCDEMVLRLLTRPDRKLYGHTLLKLLDEFPGSNPAPGLVPILNHKKETQRRIVMISQFKQFRPWAWPLTAALVAALCCLTFTHAADPDQKPPQAAKEKATAILDSAGAKVQVAESDTALERDEEGVAPLLRRSARSKTDPSKGIALLQEQLKIHDEQVRSAQAHLDALRAELGGVLPEEATQLDPETVRMIERERIAMDAQAAKFQAVREQLMRRSREDMLQMLPTVVPDQLLASALDRLSTQETELARFASQYGPGHPDVLAGQAAIANLNRQIDARVKGILAGLSAQVDANAASSAQLRKLVEDAKHRDAQMTERYVPYFRAKRDLETQQRIRETIMLRLLQEKVDAALPRSGQDAP